MGPHVGPTKALKREKRKEKRKSPFSADKGWRPPMCSPNINIKWENQSTKLKININK